MKVMGARDFYVIFPAILSLIFGILFLIWENRKWERLLEDRRKEYARLHREVLSWLEKDLPIRSKEFKLRVEATLGALLFYYELNPFVASMPHMQADIEYLQRYLKAIDNPHLSVSEDD